MTAQPDSDHSKLADAKETVISVIVMLAGLTEPWDRLDYPERCALAENELRALDDRLATDERQDGTVWDGSRWITDPDRIGKIDHAAAPEEAE